MTPNAATTTPATPSAQTNRTILLTGAAGFIGSHLAQALLSRGDAVIALDNFEPFYDPAIKRKNAQDVRAQASAINAAHRYRLIEADITNQSAMLELFQNHRPTSIIHLAAKAGVRPSIANPAAYAHTNITGTQILLTAAQQTQTTQRFVIASSSSVYGNQSKTPFSESDNVDHPISPYAASKKACELIAHTHHHLTNMPTACLRFFTVFGPRQRPDLAIAKFLHNVANQRPITLFGDGKSRRDYTYIDDIVSGVIAAHDRIHNHGYRVWNLGHAEPVTLNDMLATIERVTGTKAIIERQPMQQGDVDQTYADLARSREELDYNPQTPFEQGVLNQWRWMNS